MIETLTTAAIVLAACLVGLALLFGVILSDQNKRIARLKKELKKDTFKLQEDIEALGRNQRDLTLKEENKALRLQADTYFEQWQNEKLTSQGLREQCNEYAQDSSKFLNLLSELSAHIGDKPTSSTCRYFRGRLNALDIKER